MKAYTTDLALSDLDADLVAVGLFEGDELSEPLGSTAGASDASGDFKSKVIVYPGKPERVVIIGLGPKDGFTLEKARVAGAVAQKALKEVKGEALAWMLPDTGDLDPGGVAACLVEAAIFSAFDFDRYKSGSDGKEAPPSLKAVEINTGKDVAAMVKVGEA
ncbi:MAG TPA: M17 family peptidase N-terminal domain-containing protein, partial [Solirubrobacterales bacterium]|nr:M17 family peptidase N-terminal domain-containing protein [Solirubrobacterales bacterium]